MKKTVALLFSLVLLASMANAWGPLTHNAIAKKVDSKGSSTYRGGATAPDVFYVSPYRDDTIEGVLHQTSFATDLKSLKSDYGKGWRTHVVSDPIATYNGFGSDLILPAVSKASAEVLGYWDYGGRGDLTIRKDDILNVAAYKKYGLTKTKLQWIIDNTGKGTTALTSLITADIAAVTVNSPGTVTYAAIKVLIGSSYDKAFQNSVNAAK